MNMSSSTRPGWPAITVHPLTDPAARPVIGHRGNCAHAPENTLESFRQAVALGVDGLELDVRLSKDGQVVVMHDATVDRTTNGTGAVDSLTLAELRDFDAGAGFSRDGAFPYRGRGIGIPLLDEVLEQLPDTPLLIEIKTLEAGAAVRRVIEEHAASARCVAAAFDIRTLGVFRGSGIALSASTSHVVGVLGPALMGGRFYRLPFQMMSLPRFHRGIPLPLGSIARAVAPAGVPVHVWTVNKPATARRLWRKGIRGILADDPGVILEARARLPDDLR